MDAPPGSILPASYFEGLSTLWGACAYVASAVAAIGFVLRGVSVGWDPVNLMRLLARLFFIGIATLFLREWLMRLNDVVRAFGDLLGVDPTQVDERYVEFLRGSTTSNPNMSVWDVIWGTASVGTAICYALLWLFGWLSWGVQYIVNLLRDILLTAGWALSPLFLSFFMLRPMVGVARKYVIGLAALVCWPFGWALAAVVTNAMLEAAAHASLLPVTITNASTVGPALTVLLIGTWMIISSFLGPYVTMRIFLMGGNAAGAFAQGFGNVTQAAFAGGTGAATAMASGGAAAGGVIAAAALGAISGGAESAARGGRPASTTSTANSALAGLYGARAMTRQLSAMQESARADRRRAAAAESVAEGLNEHVWKASRKSERDFQPHHPNPTQAAIEIEARAKPKIH